MTLSLVARRRRNAQVTKMLEEKCEIKVVFASRDDSNKNENWFVPTKKGSGELKLKTRRY